MDSQKTVLITAQAKFRSGAVTDYEDSHNPLMWINSQRNLKTTRNLYD